MTSGVEVAEVYTEMLIPAMESIGDRWENGEIDIADEHQASVVATKLIGRLSSRAVRRGRPRGTILLGAPSGEHHALVVAMLADLLRIEGWDVCDLGVDTPSSSFLHVLSTLDGVVAIGLSVTDPDCLDACAATCAAFREAGVGVPVFVGGQAIRDDGHAIELGADAYAPSAASLTEVIARRGRRRATAG
jgi:MerR family transcriptional regulator, light-induced transcriptional regulator